MIAISDIAEKGQLQSRKRSLSNFLLIVNNANTSNKPKNAVDLMVALYCYCMVELNIVCVCTPRLLFMILDGLVQGLLNFWCYGALEEVDDYLRSPTINFLNKNNCFCWVGSDKQHNSN